MFPTFSFSSDTYTLNEWHKKSWRINCILQYIFKKKALCFLNLFQTRVCFSGKGWPWSSSDRLQSTSCHFSFVLFSCPLLVKHLEDKYLCWGWRNITKEEVTPKTTNEVIFDILFTLLSLLNNILINDLSIIVVNCRSREVIISFFKVYFALLPCQLVFLVSTSSVYLFDRMRRQWVFLEKNVGWAGLDCWTTHIPLENISKYSMDEGPLALFDTKRRLWWRRKRIRRRKIQRDNNCPLQVQTVKLKQ